MLDDFFTRALLAGVGIALVAGPLGCFVVWRRMAYFGDTMAHAALLGVTLAVAASLEPTLGVFVSSLAIALLLIALERIGRVPRDTLLGILSHSALSIGLVAAAFMPWLRIDLLGYLFGDVLAVGRLDLLLIWAGGAIVLAGLAWIWNDLLATTVSEEIARAEGIAAERTRILFTLLIALVIAIAIKVVGILLITALLVIPAAAARRAAISPEGMALVAALIGVAAVVAGLFASLTFDTPSGPSVVVAALLAFLISLRPRPRRAN
jgi:zinc transport system permease protein